MLPNHTRLITRLAQTARQRPGWRDLTALLAIVVIWLLFYWRLFAPIEADRVQLAPGDFTQQFLVFRNYAFQEFRAGRLPTWLSCVDSGYPYQADPQAALFYPPGLVNIGLNLLGGASQFPIDALELEAALHVLLAAAFMYVFLRGEVRRPAALIGALTFAFSGYLTGYPMLQMAIVESAAWLPLALWGARRLAVLGGPASMAFTAAPLALSVLAGHPQTYTFIFYTVAIYFVYLSWRQRLSWRVILWRLGSALALAVVLSAIQLLPSFEFVRLSTRGALAYTQAGAGFPPSDLLQLIVTGAVSHFNPLYLGLLPLVLIGVAVGAPKGTPLGAHKQRDTFFWLLLAIAGLLLSFGNNLAAFDPFYWLAPGYNVFRDQERHALIVVLAASVLAAYGADVLLHCLTHQVRVWLRSVTRWGLAGLFILFAALMAVSYLKWQGIDPSVNGDLPNHVALALIFGVAGWSVLMLRLNFPARRWPLTVMMIALVGLDLVTANRAVNWVSPYDPFPTQPSIEAVRANADPNLIFRVHNEQRLPGHSLCANSLDEVGGVTPIQVGAYADFIAEVPREVRWQLLNVQYVVTWRSALTGHLGQAVDATLLDQQGEGKDAIYTYRLAQSHPRAWIVRQVATRPDRAATYQALAEPGFDPYQIAYTSMPIQVTPASGVDQVAVTKIDPAHIAIAVDATSAGLLVVSEVNYPGWVATVNGQDAPVVEVDGLLRSVLLPAGRSRVEMAFRPMALIVGSIVSGLGLIGWLGLIVLGRRRTHAA